MPKKILVADDSLFMRKVLRDILSDKYEIIEADSGIRAEEQFIKEKPDLILLDIIMPEGEEEGIRILKSIMRSDKRTKIVMITAVGQNSIVEKCRELGARDYITKPFDEKKVIKTVKKYIE